PERLQGAPFDRRSDVFSSGVVLWEMLALERLFPGQAGRSVAARPSLITPPSLHQPDVPPGLDPLGLPALAPVAADRSPTALDFVLALERVCPPASSREVAAWVTEVCGPRLRDRANELARIETISTAEDAAEQAARKGRMWTEAHSLDVGD